MKKWILLFLLAVLLLSGCGASDAPQPPQTADTTTTLMIYMIGSDLEAKAGAGTRDLEEIAASGVDLDRVNVLVYAGGSPHWHNESASAQEHTLLSLTADGFTRAATGAAYSMGEAACLANFLTYAHDAYPADEYALILWDHGDGPVIGYGKDMLFDNDTLTLAEMKQALEASPFAEETLSWVGFDACLMASAELSCIWAEHARYLVASQEVEPSFGWDYRFLSQLGHTDTVSLMNSLTAGYLQTCEAYYESRGYENRDTTLSCVDLSFAGQLNTAINNLFAKACEAMEENYNAITSRRVSTRALGRASTGSEYDLIDLADMARQFADIYPQESEQLQSVLGEMVIANASNTENCGGLSLYYPFYNKSYYEESWGQIYTQLGLFPDYIRYLQKYQAIWLESDLLENAVSQTPEESSAGTYTLQLTPQQQESFASAQYYILVRDGEEYFTRIFSSRNVTNENGLLTAGFDGNVLYVKDDFGNYQIPVTLEHDTVGNQSRYSVFVTLMNYSLNALSLPEGFEEKTQAHRFSLTLDNSTKAVAVNSLVPYDHQTGTDILVGGKLTETELTDWQSCFFRHDDHRYLSRYENGAVMPVDQWPVSTLFSGYEFPIENGLEFVCAPLAAGEYYLLFQVEDTQGNRYCSELLPIRTDGTLETPIPANPVDIDWTDGDRVLLTRQAGVEVFLAKAQGLSGNETYILEATNTNDYPVTVEGSDLFWGQDVFCDSFFGSISLDPGQTAAADYGADLGTPAELGMLTDKLQIRFSLSVQNGITGAYILYQQPFRVTLSEDTMLSADEVSTLYNSFRQPLYSALAYEQLLLETEQARVTLLGLGGNGKDATLRGAICIENLSDQPLDLSPEGMVLNGVYFDANSEIGDIPAHSRAYRYFQTYDYTLEPAQLTSVETVSILLRSADYSPLFTGNTQSHLYWRPVTLAQSGPASEFREGTQVLFEENGIRVSLLSTDTIDHGPQWQLSLVNDTDCDIALDLTDIIINGISIPRGSSNLHISNAQAGAHQKCVFTLKYYDSQAPLESALFRFRVMDFNKESILFTGTQQICLREP